MTTQYSRLLGKTFDDGGYEVTVIEPRTGLAPGWVTVRDGGGRRNENLPYVLNCLGEKPEDIEMASDMLGTVQRIVNATTRIAASVSEREPPDGTETLKAVACILEEAADEAEAALAWLANVARAAPTR